MLFPEDEDEFEKVILLFAGLKEGLKGVEHEPLVPLGVSWHLAEHESVIESLAEDQQFFDCPCFVVHFNASQ